MVIDASAAVHFLTAGEHGDWVAERIHGAELDAPHILDLEVAQVLRKLVARRALSQERAGEAVLDLAQLAVRRHGHVSLLARIWQLRHTVSAYDAAYVALAEALDTALLTADSRLSRAPGLPVEVIAP